MGIPFTQYLRPNGRKRPMIVDRPAHVEEMASVIYNAGGRFTCEELGTGEVSLACEFADADIAIEVCPNGPEVEASVDRMIGSAYRHITGLEPPKEHDAKN